MSESEMSRKLTPKEVAEKAVGLTFNPSNDPNVQKVKELCAAMIEFCYEVRDTTMSGEVKRMMSIAITEAQTAQMWAVKAVTWKD